MGVLQVKKQTKKYDAIIVGSGAGGGMAAHTLAHAGLQVCLLEAGPDFDPAIHSAQLKFAYESPRRGAGTTFRPFGDFDGAFHGWNISGEPYMRATGTEWEWFRARMVGGRTNHWGRISLRFGPKDFKRKSIDGLGENWPISYDDIKPYYDRIDKMLGVFGSNEGLPNDPDGIFLPPPKMRLHEMFIKKAATNVKIPVIPARLSILTKPINNDRGSCFFCNQCGRSCKVYADFSSSSCLVKPALGTKNVDLIVGAMVREVLTNKEGLATGVSYVDKKDLQEYQVSGRVVILAASTCETARLLLNSKSARHSNGLANSSGVVGKYLHDSTGASMSGFVPALLGRKRYNEDGVGGDHIYSPWWLDNKKLDFPRGYHIEYGGGMTMPMYGFGFGLENNNGKYSPSGPKEPGGYGKALKDDARFFYGASVHMAGRGEAVARADNYCEIDPQTVDKYGIPVLRFHVKHSDYEIKQAKHMKQTFAEIFHSMGAIVTSNEAGNSDANLWGLEAPGKIIHEAGTVRMGDSAKTSALNGWNQAHDCKNLFCMDGSSFTSQADKNITWTILALALRASEHIVDEMKKNNI